ncbi:hypothetical protein KL942_002309 [Ogataea angusta]|uniref:Nucleolar complex protein 2 n=1 Tax=Pichia angusta TaxID=870730 RepID=A0ABQ7RZ16_PICAN|nr:hypothetical protein KL942_002309 [Ogataea angusta]KAG7850266.1 hypothetical protein KL940_001826 [Ogataea angusta]KAG7861482.1 hypothetical protein KL919_002216 [Ogataea angusta]
MAKAKKSTKKFQAKNLKSTIEQRKKVQKYNKLHKKKGSSGSAPQPEDKRDKEIFEDMDVEEFFDADIDVPKKAASKSQKDEDSEDDSSSSGSEAELDAQDLKDLEKDDPEFYKYLQENDKDLLDFKPVNPLEAMSDDEDDEDVVEEERAEEEETREGDTIEVTLDMIKQWEANLRSDQPTIKTLKTVVIAFKAAVHTGSSGTYKYSVTDEKAFHKLMFLALQQLTLSVQKLVPYKISSHGTRNLPSNKKVAQISTLLKSHAGSLILLLNDITNTETATLVLKSVQELLPYYVSHRKLIKEMMNAVVNVWSSSQDVETQIAAFAFLNNSSREFPKAILELVLKTTYSSFIKKCRKTNVHTMPMINFQKNSAVELFGIDKTLSFQVGFEYIRQLAIHLRNSVNNTTKDSYKAIYNWQYCHSLDFWSRMISAHCHPETEKANKKESPLRQLIYPLVQVTLGAIRLLPTAQFFPLRFYLIRSLIRLSQNTGVYIPLFPLVVEVLNSSAVTKKPKHANLQAVSFDYVIKVPKQYLGSRVYQEGLIEQVVELAAEFFVLHCKSIAFPELITPAVIYLRRYMKKSTNIKLVKQLGTLVEKLNANAKYIEKERSSVEFGPNNRVEVGMFLHEVDWQKTPLGAYVAVQREVKETREKALRESLESDVDGGSGGSDVSDAEEVDVDSEEEE